MTANTRVRFRILKSLLLSLLVFCGCVSSKPLSPRPESGPPATSGYGYALLFDLMGDQKNVSKLLIIKRERPEFGSLIKEIADRSAAAHKQLERFEKAERSLNLKGRGLPAAEVRTRESISKARGKELITDKGKYFEVHLLLAQNEALTYGAHLAAVTATMEDNLERIRFLQQLSSDLTQLQQRVVAMLMANYSWSPPRQ
jgi:hypothetical protein